jgi:hypothetical protein
MLVAPGTDLNTLPPVNLPNYKVDDDNLRAAIDKAYEDDIRLGRMREVDTPPRFISPVFGRVEPKPDGTIKYRRLVDLSAPGGKMSGLSVNSSATHAKFSMHTIPKATASLIPNGWQYVVDFKDAYQSFAVYPGHCELMGTRRPGTQAYTVSTVLVFGGSASAENFCDASSAIAACGSARGCERLVVHIDDVKGVEISNIKAQEALATIKFLMHDLGCEDSPKKEQLAKRVLYCGVWWDTDANGDDSAGTHAGLGIQGKAAASPGARNHAGPTACDLQTRARHGHRSVGKHRHAHLERASLPTPAPGSADRSGTATGRPSGATRQPDTP